MGEEGQEDSDIVEFAPVFKAKKRKRYASDMEPRLINVSHVGIFIFN